MKCLLFCDKWDILKTLKKHYRVDRRQIAFIKFILEAHDGIAVQETVDPVKGIIKLHIAPGCGEQVAEILRDLQKDILIRPLTSIPFEQENAFFKTLAPLSENKLNDE
jgi:hypothetical protein